ncbi:glutamine amidotransferase [Phytobacter sp. V91]|uniref:glutamine amidotransferase n=1 Tax=Phytobacter sp. V91 TaxID=3369425 RepID=UPI003F60CB4B
MAERPLIILQVGLPSESIRNAHGDIPSWFCRAIEHPLEQTEVVRVFEGEPLPPPDANRVAVITGSWAMVTDRLPWSEATAEWIRHAMAIGMSLFGVCYGHQLMAHALGGEVEWHPEGREVGSQAIRLHPHASNDLLLSTLPHEFPAHLTHMQTVTRLPEGALGLASSAHDPHQIVRYGPHAMSTQFHPEFTPELASDMIHQRQDALASEGFDPQALLSGVQPSPEATDLLRRFVHQAFNRDGQLPDELAQSA